MEQFFVKVVGTVFKNKENPLSKRNLIVLVLVLAAVSVTAYWYNPNPPGVIMINPARPPKPMLDDAEVEKLVTLQNTQNVFLLSGVSPDHSLSPAKWARSTR